MCGITGILNINGEPVSISILKKMTEIISHRGPDAEGFWVDSYIGFGHRRLSIIDISSLGNQPMQTEDGRYIITYNGEIYNYVNLRVELESKGYNFFSKTDTEVVLKSYAEWGNECVRKFNGMFAFAIWDKKKKCLFIGRDRYGIKPLYYYNKNDVFVFASEIKSILKHPKYEFNVSLEALNEYFSFQNIFTDLTLFKDVKLLPPSTCITIKYERKLNIEFSKYWDYNFKDDNSLSEQDCIKEVKRLFEQAVERQLQSDVEIGSYLSGGLDSGSITCIAAKNFNNLKTFSCGFDLSSASGLELAFDERERAEYLSNLFKTEQYEIVLKAGDMERVMSKLIWHLEDLRVGQSYPNYYVARLASKFVKVVLSGAGGDELFAGYPWRYYRAVINNDSDQYIDKYYSYWQRLINDNDKNEFFVSGIFSDSVKHNTKIIFQHVFNGLDLNLDTPGDYVNRSLYFEIKTFLHGLLVVEDKLSMAHSLETRVPFLDNDLVDFAMKIPVKYKLKNLTKIIKLNENDLTSKEYKYSKENSAGKNVLRKVLSNYVPKIYIDNSKQGFSAPDASWFKGESIEYIMKLLFNKKALIYDFIQPKMAQRLLNEHFSGRKNNRLLIWSLVCFEWWLKMFAIKNNK
ncbi:MAG: asparagine synthase (glutamine-hydrolyzing) [Ignavibacteriae bacterium]|nr:asparagine synthase (glutamine-hydrolyzing) [Ignavibacteriota bacterium]